MTDAIRVIRLRYSGQCHCGKALSRGDLAGWNPLLHKAICLECLERQQAPDAVHETGTPGDSLQRTYDARAKRRGDGVRAAHPVIGGLLLAVSKEPASISAFAKGADGERKAVERILGRAGENVEFLFNRRLGVGQRNGDIDMIAVTPAGILVVDVKHYRNATVDVRSTGGLLTARVDRLFVAGRDRTKWVDSLIKQREAVSAVVGERSADAIPIRTALCFVNAQLPFLRRLSINDVAIVGSRELGRRLKRVDGPIDVEQRRYLVHLLSERLPAA